MKVRFKKGKETFANKFNPTGVGEVLTGDDSVFISDLNVWLESKKEWKDMSEAFRDHDLIVDNYNTYFFEPRSEEDRKRGFVV